MDLNPQRNKKVGKFQPKIPTRKAVKREVIKNELSESKDDFVDKELLAKLHNTGDGFGRFIQKTGSSAQVAFGDSSKARTFGNPRSIGKQPKEELNIPALYAAPEEDEYEEYEELEEQWDYSSYYRTSLPLRRPDSEKPENLALSELRQASTCPVDEPRINAAAELGLTENAEEPELIFFQLPTNLPLWKRPAVAEGDIKREHESRPGRPPFGRKVEEPKKACKLEELPPGLMGKLRVYKSGVVKLKLGDSEFDVAPGVKTVFAQELAAINTIDRHCCILGEIAKRAVITPDVDSLLDTMENLSVRRA